MSITGSGTLVYSAQYTGYEELQETCRMVENGLIDVKNALSTLRTTCTTLEAHTEQLELDISVLKAAIFNRKPYLYDRATHRSRSTMTDAEIASTVSSFAIVDHYSEPHTPPSTPRHLKKVNRPSSLKSRSVINPDNAYGNVTKTASLPVLPTRRLTRASKRTSERGLDSHETTLEELIFPPRVRKSPKRVRFLESEHLPVSDIRTPSEELFLRSDSDELVLPAPMSPIASETKLRVSESTRPKATENSRGASPTRQTFKVYIRIPSRRPKLSPQIHLGDGFSTENMLQHSRTKTMWDPSSGKRVPISKPTAQSLVKAESSGS